METEFYGPALPPQFSQRLQSKFGSDPNRSDPNSKQSERVCLDTRQHKVRAKYVPSCSSSEESEVSVQVKKSSKPKGASSEQDKQIQILFFMGR